MTKYGIRELMDFVGHDCLIFFSGLDGKTIYDATGCVVAEVHNWLTLAHRQDGTEVDLSGEHILHIDKLEATNEK